MNHPVAVIGAGPAGMSAAIQLARLGIDPLVFERHRPGGLLWNAFSVENYPGFPEGISGPDLVERFRRQFVRWVPHWLGEEALMVGREGSLFRVRTHRSEYSVGRVILASGTRPGPVHGIEIDPSAANRVFRDVGSIPHRFPGEWVVVGGGDAAFDHALWLAESATVSLFMRGAQPRALPLLRERARCHPQIRVRAGVTVVAVRSGPAGGLGIEILHRGRPESVFAGGVVLALGREAETGCLATELVASEGGEPCPGLIWVGDVAHVPFRQVAIAVGDGVRAALRVERELLRGG